MRKKVAMLNGRSFAQCCVRLVAIFILVLLCAARISAHPGPGIAAQPDGSIVFVIGPAHQIWRITPDGTNELIATGGLDQPLRVPHHLARDSQGRLHTASDAGSRVLRIENDDSLSQVYPPDDQDHQGIIGIGGCPFIIAPNGDFIAARSVSQRRWRIDRVKPDGSTTLLAGSAEKITDGAGEQAGIGDLHSAGFAWGPDSALHFTDSGTRVRKVSMDGRVTTIAGGDERAFDDGLADEARFQGAMGLVVKDDGDIIVADAAARRVRSVDSQGNVSTIAGDGTRGGTDGPGDDATFDEPVGVTLDREGNILVLDWGRDADSQFVRIRRIDADRNVSTVTRIGF